MATTPGARQTTGSRAVPRSMTLPAARGPVLATTGFYAGPRTAGGAR
ncbi:hypothetical protein [Longimycelium tulufanense]|nr:hypothetical protein [Longimycelium tulufanense]